MWTCYKTVKNMDLTSAFFQYQEAISVYLDAVETRPSHYEPHSLFNMIGGLAHLISRFAMHLYEQ